MKNIITVFKKEFYRVMSDRRLIFTAILLPGLAIYVMYSFIGNAIGNQVEDITTHTIVLYVENMPDAIDTLLDQSDRSFDIVLYDPSEHGDLEEDILAGDVDLLVQFPEDFETTISQYEDDGYIIPEVDFTYNPGERYSSNAYNVVYGIMQEYHYSISYERYGDGIYTFMQNQIVVVDEEKATGQEFASLLPMIIIMFLFSGAMSIGPDSIAGEKERGTIATLLVTPIKRSELAIGKVLSLSIISLMSAASSFIGILLSLPKLMQGQSLDANIYGVSDYIAIFGILLATVLLIVAMVSTISAYAKTIKEASMLILPVYFISIIVAVSTMFGGQASETATLYAIPIYNSINMLISILTFEIVPMHYLIMVVSNVVYTIVLIFFMNKLFESETVMFSK